MRPIEGRHVLLALVAFFGVMLAVNAVFVYFATSTFSGISTEDAYRKGLRYNQTLDAHRAQLAQGWQYQTAYADGTVQLTVQGPEGQAVERLDIRGRLGRPATDAQDRTIRFAWRDGGVYLAPVGALDPGQWDLTAAIAPPGAEGAEPYRLEARLWVEQ